MGNPSVGALGQMALDATSSFSSSSKWIEFNSESISKKGVIVDSAGIRGTRSHSAERVRSGPYKINGTVQLDCSIAALDTLLAYILGAGPASHVYSLAEALPSFYLMIDRGAKVFLYSGCSVSKATFSASARDPRLRLALEIEAETESLANGGSFPGGMTRDTGSTYLFSDSNSGLSINGTTYSAFDWELSIDNGLLADRFVNELSRSQIPATDRIVRVRMTTPWSSSETGLYNVGVGAFGSGSFVFTNPEESGSVLTFAVPGLLQYPSRSPVITRKQDEIKLTLDMIARQNGSNPELTITNAHG